MGQSDRVTSIGCFSSLEHGQSADLVIFDVGLNEDLQDCLSEILRQESKPKQSKKRKRAITTTPRNNCEINKTARVSDIGSNNTENNSPTDCLEVSKSSAAYKLRYILRGRAGVVFIKPGDSLLYEALMSNLSTLSYVDSEKSNKRSREETICF